MKSILISRYIRPCILIVNLQLSIVNSCFAQDPQFTTSYAGMTYTNPAFAGCDTMGTVYMAHRNQWPKLPGTYQTTVIGSSFYLKDLNAYSGIHYMHDQAGSVRTDRITFNYAQNIKIKKLLLRPAFEAVYFQKEVDWSQLSFGDQIDPRQAQGFVYSSGDVPRGGSISNIDFNSGLLSSFYDFTFGISIHHLTQPNEALVTGESPLPRKTGLFLSYDLHGLIGRGEMHFTPYFSYHHQNNFSNLNYGLNIKLLEYLIGFQIRKKDSFALIAGYSRFNMRLTYCYEITTSSLENKMTGGTHEITYAIKFWKIKAHPKFVNANSAFYLM